LAASKAIKNLSDNIQLMFAHRKLKKCSLR
jgi:hypothetical protein